MGEQNHNSANVKLKLSFASFYKENNIEIPVIQRDYVQGSNRQAEKRDSFIDSLFETLTGQNDSCDLDFVYGTFNHESFIPLDGQQRLTTLYLLHWFLINKCRIENPDVVKDIQKEFVLESNEFSYMTRRSSSAFCKKLNNYCPNKWPEKISEDITEKTWFSEVWKQDPTVMAMLDMLDALDKKYKELKEPDLQSMLDVLLNTDKVNFDCLDMGEYKLTDSLYVKMNARGKQLTEFENWKAKFIQFLEEQYEDVEFSQASEKKKVDHSLVKDYFSHSIEHDWTDLFWTYAVKDYLAEKANYDPLDENKKKLSPSPESPLIDNLFLGYYYYIYRMLSLLEDNVGDVNNEEITNGTEATRKALFGKTKNIEFLFSSLDTFAQIDRNNKGIKCNGFFNNLFYLQGRKSDGSVRLFSSENADLLESCIKNKASVDEQILLFCIIVYCVKNRCYTVTEELKKYARVCRNLIESIYQRTKKDMKIHSNTRLAHLSKYYVTIEHLCSVCDLSDLENFEAGMGNVASAYQWMKSYPNEDIYQLEDSGYTHGCMDAFNKEGNIRVLREALDAFRELTELQKARIFIAFDFKGVDFGSCSHGTRYFFGFRERWDVLFRYEYGIENVKSAFQAFADEFSKTKDVNDIIARKLNELNGQDCFKYYFLKYDGFANSTLRWIMNESETPTEVDGHHFFAMKSDFDVITLPRFSSKPVSGYHTDPYASAVCQIIRKNNLAVYNDLDYTGEDKYKAPIYLRSQKIDMLCTDMGWKIRFNEEPVSQETMDVIQAKCKMESDGNYYIKHVDMDRVETAVLFIEELYALVH